AWIEDVEKKFHRPLFVLDPYQMEATVQKYTKVGYRIETHEARGGKANYELAVALHGLIVNRRLAWYEDCGTLLVRSSTLNVLLEKHTLADEFSELIVKEMAYGYRIDHLPNKHDDRVVGLGMGALALIRQPGKLHVTWDSDKYF